MMSIDPCSLSGRGYRDSGKFVQLAIIQLLIETEELQLLIDLNYSLHIAQTRTIDRQLHKADFDKIENIGKEILLSEDKHKASKVDLLVKLFSVQSSMQTLLCTPV